jgi:RNA polymerase sigma factor (sigma-70 family)
MSVATAPPASALDVAVLLDGIGRNDPHAWAEIIRRYGRFVTAKARSFRMQDADVHDAVQMTWVRLGERSHAITQPERLSGWLATTVTRECWLILGRTRRLVYISDAIQERPDLGDEPERLAVDRDTATILNAAVAQLPPPARDLVNALFGPEPLPYAELSRRFDMPIGSIGPTRARHLRRLRGMLAERGITSAA